MRLFLIGTVCAAPLGSEFFRSVFGMATADIDFEETAQLPPKYEPVFASNLPEDAPFVMQQPGVGFPAEQKIRALKWGHLNFIHTTDTHAWLGGHRLEPQFGADWGDFVSFTERMQLLADDKGSDLIIVDTGDRNDGNGLGDATKEKGTYIRKLFTQASYDLITVGNHELYDGHVTVHEYEEIFPAFGASYVSSNVYVKAKKVKAQQYAPLVHTGDIVDLHKQKWIPMGNKYKIWQTKNTNATLLGLGFLFDFNLNDDHYSKVVKVEKEVKEEWFQSLLQHEIKKGEVDAIVLSGHIPVRDSPQFKLLVEEIRKHNKDIPIVLFGGHTHIRDAVKYDEKAWALESGRYLETVGFASVEIPSLAPPPHDPHHPKHPHDPTHPPHHGPHPPHHGRNGSHPRPPHHVPNGTHPNGSIEALSAPSYFRSYIDFNRRSLITHSESEGAFDTSSGRSITREIAEYRKKLDLDHKIACVPRTFYTNRAPYPASDSVFSLLGEYVLPQVVTKHRQGHSSYVMLNTGAIRYDLVKGPYTKDSGYIVTPFSRKWMVIEELPRELADEVISILNGYDSVSEEIGFRQPSREAEQMHNTTLTPGYVTEDDFGSTGDDTKHKPWPFYSVPNVIHAERDVRGDSDQIDLVFEEFMTHFVVKALVDMRKYRWIHPRFYAYLPLEELIGDYLNTLDTTC